VKQSKKIHPSDNQRKEENIKGVKKRRFSKSKKKKQKNKQDDLCVFLKKKYTI